MEIGIITYSNAQNYGAMLQAYALTNYICTLGYNCTLINYRKFDQRWFKPRKTLTDIIITFILRNQGRKRISRYHKFRKEYLKLTHLCNDLNDLKELNSYFDTFIAGSDQIWNCNVCVNDAFYLHFVDKHKLRISYAPSFGSPVISEKHKKKIVKYLKNFDHISTREKSGAQLVKQLTGNTVSVVLDPVFLVNRKDWIQILPTHKPLNEKYIFVYTTEVNKKLFSMVCRLSKKKSLKVISTQFIPGCKCITKKDIGPLEFLQLIYYSDYVLSTSYHATAFSIIFNKAFGTYLHSQTGTRVHELLSDLCIGNQILDEEKDVTDSIDWKKVNQLLDQRIQISKKYLSDALKGKSYEL